MAETQGDIEKRIGELGLFDARRLRRRYRRAGDDPQRRAALIGEIEEAEAALAARQRAVPRKIAYPEDLPIVAARDELLELIAGNQVLVVAGETGSGKSTQLPKLCLELGRGVRGRIGHTQPRRLAARSIAERVAEELGTPVGQLVGYKFRFVDQVADTAAIKVMTDGILLNELQRSRDLLEYDTLIIDEAHERSLNVDFLLGYIKQLLPRRPDLKVVITSATIDTERFAEHFDAPVIEISGRTYPVEIRYRPLTGDDATAPVDQTDGIVAAVTELAAEGPGDILVFCSGEREIRDATDALRHLNLRHTEILPLYGRLSAAEQHRVFSGHVGRRVVVSTNVAETSLTVPGIRFVVDSGTARISRYSKRTKVQRLPIEAISQASADQRAGRCGRIGPGICIRLYSAEDYMTRPEFTDPEILRTSLAAVLLQMASVGLGDVSQFPFIEPPDTRSIKDGVALLEELEAVSGSATGTRDWLTPVGRQLARIPVDPRLGRMLLASSDLDCLKEMLVIVSGLSVIDPRERPTGKEANADQLHSRFRDENSDFATLLNLWRYISEQRRELTSSKFRRMCRDEFLSWRRLREWQDIHSQLRRSADELGLKRNRKPAASDDLTEALLAGLLANVGSKDPDSFEYRGTRGSRFALSPASVLFKRSPQWVMAAELVETTRVWAHVAAPLTGDLVERVGSHLVRRSYSDPWWSAERGAAVVNETVTLLGLTLEAGREVLAYKVDPTGARSLFIRHALVRGEWDAEHAFVAHNTEVLAEVERLEARGRRVDLLVAEEVMERFYDVRVPDSIVSVRHFDRWWRDARSSDPHVFDMTLDDLIAADAPDVAEEDFPVAWRHGADELHLRYEFDIGSETDGVTVEIPVGILDRIDPAIFEWNVPGFRTDLIAALLRSLPKQIRKRLLPLPGTAAEIASSIHPSDGSLIEALRRRVGAITGTVVMPDDFDKGRVPVHLLPRFEVVAPDGAVVAAGRDLDELRSAVLREARETVITTHPLERRGLTYWDFDELPRQIMVEGQGAAVPLYPTLVDEGDSVAIRLVATPREQIDAMWAGTRRLLAMSLPSPRRLLGVDSG